VRVAVWVVVAASVAALVRVDAEGASDPSSGSLKAALEQQVRAILEPALRSSAGVGFRTFGCDLPTPFEPGSGFRCEAIDEDGDWLGYAIKVAKDGSATVILASERAKGLDPEARATLEAPSREFLVHYQDRDWDALVSELHPALREQGGFDEARRDLAEMRDLFGAVESAKLEIHSVRHTGRQELVYALDCEHGHASLRLGLAPDDHGTWRVVAFLLSAPPGSPEQAMLLERVGRARLSQVTGEVVKRVDAPFDRLLIPGDAVEGTLELEDGRRMPMRVAQTGWRDDFDPVDYRFSILDVAWLVRRALAATLASPVEVTCETPVVPDGGETKCTAVGGDGTRREVVVTRSGGAHRMRALAPLGSQAAPGRVHDPQARLPSVGWTARCANGSRPCWSGTSGASTSCAASWSFRWSGSTRSCATSSAAPAPGAPRWRYGRRGAVAAASPSRGRTASSRRGDAPCAAAAMSPGRG
jgi:hypothetical protein